MAVSVDGGGGDRRKSLTADLNLVPYIDLLTCMVAFLLITAVWTQLARLEVQQHGQGQATTSDDTRATKITVVVHASGFNLIVNEDQKPLPGKGPGAGGGLDYGRLTTELEALKKAYPDKSDVLVASDDAIKFDTLVKTMDAAMAAGFPDLSLVDAAAGP